MQKNTNRIKMIQTAATACTAVLALGVSVLPTNAAALSNGRMIAAQDAGELRTVKADKTQLRCGDQDVFYAIAELPAGTTFEVLGTSSTYTKIRMPADIGAFVPVNEVDATTSGKTVVLVVESKLRAPSRLMGLSGSWKGVFNTPLAVGTQLPVLENLLDNSGEIVGYRVSPPTGVDGELAIAYIKTDALRAPTSKEIEAYNAGNGGAATPPKVEPKPEPKPEPVTEPVTEPTPEPETKPAVPSDVDTSLMDDMADGDNPSEPVEITNSTPTKIDDESSNTTAEPAAPTRQTAKSGRVSAAALEDLEATFENARKLPKGELDEALDELKAEFTRTRNEAEDGSSLAKALDQRLEWIAIRIQTRDQRRAIDAVLAAYDAKADQRSRDIEAWQSGRAYQLVGRMVTSSVYTGEHLPLLYRIQAIDPSSGATRTIGYVAPNTDQDFRHLLGKVVGVVGSMNNDDSLKLRIIEPDRIDPMPQ